MKNLYLLFFITLISDSLAQENNTKTLYKRITNDVVSDKVVITDNTNKSKVSIYKKTNDHFTLLREKDIPIYSGSTEIGNYPGYTVSISPLGTISGDILEELFIYDAQNSQNALVLTSQQFIYSSINKVSEYVGTHYSYKLYFVYSKESSSFELSNAFYITYKERGDKFLDSVYSLDNAYLSNKTLSNINLTQIHNLFYQTQNKQAQQGILNTEAFIFSPSNSYTKYKKLKSLELMKMYDNVLKLYQAKQSIKKPMSDLVNYMKDSNGNLNKTYFFNQFYFKDDTSIIENLTLLLKSEGYNDISDLFLEYLSDTLNVEYYDLTSDEKNSLHRLFKIEQFLFPYKKLMHESIFPLGKTYQRYIEYLNKYSMTPERVNIYYQMGEFLSRGKSYNESNLLLANVIANYPNFVTSYLIMGDNYWGLGAKQQAKENYQLYLDNQTDKSKIPQRVKLRLQ